MIKLSAFLLIIVTNMVAACHYEGEDLIKFNSFELFNQATLSYEEKDYSKAYELINKSYEKYPKKDSRLKIIQKCTHIKSGPFGSVRTPYTQKRFFDFNRDELIYNIKKYMPPRPMVVVEILKSKEDNLKVTVLNLLNTKENKSRAFQTPLNKFIVEIDNQTIDFGLINSDQSVTKKVTKKISNGNLHIKTKEQFGFQTATY